MEFELPPVQRGHYGSLYRSAESLDDLMVRAAEATCVAAAAVYQELRLPRRGRWILAITRGISRSRYEAHLQLTDGAFIACLIAAAGKFVDELKALGHPSSELAAAREQLAAWGGAAYLDLTKASADQRSTFEHRLAAALTQHEEQPWLDDGSRLGHVVAAVGPHKSSAFAVRALRSLIDSPMILEPFAFRTDFIRLRGDA